MVARQCNVNDELVLLLQQSSLAFDLLQQPTDAALAIHAPSVNTIALARSSLHNFQVVVVAAAVPHIAAKSSSSSYEAPKYKINIVKKFIQNTFHQRLNALHSTITTDNNTQRASRGMCGGAEHQLRSIQSNMLLACKMMISTHNTQGAQKNSRSKRTATITSTSNNNNNESSTNQPTNKTKKRMKKTRTKKINENKLNKR